MSTLQERLERIRVAFGEKASDDAKVIVKRATGDLRASGIMDRIPRPGSKLQPFELPGAGGQLVRSDELLGRGPLVINVYRGGW